MSSTMYQRALVIGTGTLAEEVTAILANRGIEVQQQSTLYEKAGGPKPELIFHLWFPEPGKHSAKDVSDYPRELLQHGQEACAELASSYPSSAIIHFAFLPAIFVGTELEDHASTLRGGITGVTRTLARKFGKQGVRVTCVQAGLVDMPETMLWVSDVVKEVQVPTKRWANPNEIAKFLVFLAADSLYTTGQTMIIDGGLTAGISGT